MTEEAFNQFKGGAVIVVDSRRTAIINVKGERKPAAFYTVDKSRVYSKSFALVETCTDSDIADAMLANLGPLENSLNELRAEIQRKLDYEADQDSSEMGKLLSEFKARVAGYTSEQNAARLKSMNDSLLSALKDKIVESVGGPAEISVKEGEVAIKKLQIDDSKERIVQLQKDLDTAKSQGLDTQKMLLGIEEEKEKLKKFSAEFEDMKRQMGAVKIVAGIKDPESDGSNVKLLVIEMGLRYDEKTGRVLPFVQPKIDTSMLNSYAAGVSTDQAIEIADELKNVFNIDEKKMTMGQAEAISYFQVASYAGDFNPKIHNKYVGYPLRLMVMDGDGVKKLQFNEVEAKWIEEVYLKKIHAGDQNAFTEFTEYMERRVSVADDQWDKAVKLPINPSPIPRAYDGQEKSRQTGAV